MILVDLNVLLNVLQKREPHYRASAAESSGCEAVVTRNVKDFAGSPVTALTPEEYLVTLDSEG